MSMCAASPDLSASGDEPVIAWLAGCQAAMVALLRELVSIDSGSHNKPGIDAVGAVLRRFLESHGIAVETIPQRIYGDCLRVIVPARDPAGGKIGGGKILLLGHRDTVYPDGEAARRPFMLSDGIATGPGVADMKAGLVMNAFLLAAFARNGGAPGPLVGLFTGDEEVGSPEGRAVIETEARGARAVFNAEPGRPSGNVVSRRKGGVFMALRITGKAAHSGGSFTDGISAIEELARKIVAIHALTDLARGITLNVGLVSGGQSVNTVAPWAEGRIDFRYVVAEDRAEILETLRTITARSFVPGTRATLEIRGEFLPLTQDDEARSLLALYARSAAASGFTPSGEFSGGCADSGFTAALGAPTLCAVGPVGGKAHSPEEFLLVETIVPRAAACARTILGLGATA
ncbi:MAG TPA: M20 family metallopeptidase [Acetobacteraceae bacterium]|nr:M20 family metallopeptidase [Acetobacteraceae bacterium]